jgi:zinc protease
MRGLAGALLLVLVFCSPGVGQVRKTTLPNGLTVLTKEVHSAPVVSVQMWYRVGSRNERPGTTGISHLLEHMAFKATRHYRSGETTRIVTSKGGHDNGFTWLDFTGYETTLPSAYWQLPLRFEAERMTSLLLDSREFEAERTVVLSELEGDENDPTFYLGQAVRATAFMAHPYQWQTIGWKSDVRSVSRDALAAYYRAHYAPNNAILVMVGDFDTPSVLVALKRLFGRIPRRPSAPPVTTTEPPQEGQRRVDVKRPAGASYVQIALHVPQISNPDHIPLDVVQNILGSGRACRLYTALVDKGLATSVDVWHYDNIDPTLMEIFATVGPGSSCEAVEQAIWAEIDRLRSAEVSAHELERAINRARADFVYNLDSTSDQAYRLGVYQTINSYEYVDNYLPAMAKVTGARVKEIAARYLTRDNSTVGFLMPSAQPEMLPAGPRPPGPAHLRRPTARHHYVRHRQVARKLKRPSRPRTRPAAVATKRVPSLEATQVRKVMPNGLVVIAREDHTVPSVALFGMMKGGSIYDPPGKEGLANFTAAMLSQGTQTRTWQQIAEALEFAGADFSAASSLSFTALSGRSLKNDLTLLLEIAADQVRRPSFPADQVEKVRKEIQNAIRESLEDPAEVVERSLYAAIYAAGHPFHHIGLGDVETVEKITRDDLVAFHKAIYRPERLALVLVGDFSAQAAIDVVNKYLADWKPDEQAPPYSVAKVDLPAKSHRQKISMKGKSQAEIAVAWRGLSRNNPDYNAALLLNYLLGGGYVSRLNDEIRDREGLAYYCFSQFRSSYFEGPWVLHMGVNTKNVEKAVLSALAVIERMRAKPPSLEEMSLWKDYVTGRLALRMETNAGVAEALADAEFYKRGLDYPWRLPQIIRSITPAQVHEAARKYLHPDRAEIIVAGP